MANAQIARSALVTSRAKIRLTLGRVAGAKPQPLAIAVPRRLDPAFTDAPLIQRLAPGEQITADAISAVGAAALAGRVSIIAGERWDEAYQAFRALIDEAAA